MPDFAHQMRWPVDVAYPDAPVIRVVIDNPVSRTGQVLNIHRMAVLQATFPAADARRIVGRLDFHHTPRHASRLNMAELEFSVLTRDYLRGHHGDGAALGGAIDAYEPGATPPKPPSIGTSAPRTLAPNSVASIPAIPELNRY
jgi:hypothetical protein